MSTRHESRAGSTPRPRVIAIPAGGPAPAADLGRSLQAVTDGHVTRVGRLIAGAARGGRASGGSAPENYRAAICWAGLLFKIMGTVVDIRSLLNPKHLVLLCLQAYGRQTRQEVEAAHLFANDRHDFEV